MLQLCSYETIALGYSAFCNLFSEEDFLNYEYYYDLVSFSFHRCLLIFAGFEMRSSIELAGVDEAPLLGSTEATALEPVLFSPVKRKSKLKNKY